jgi:endogenous inhibitor of DNA gyrase (YacG/DUF329 family)
MNAIRVVNCPNCSDQVEWSPASRFRPFCSERCKMVDLGAWANEKFRIPDPGGPDDEESEGKDRLT